MQVRGGTPHAFKILHCNHAEGRARLDWWTALQALKRAYRLSIEANEDKAMSIRHSPYLGYAGAGPAFLSTKSSEIGICITNVNRRRHRGSEKPRSLFTPREELDLRERSERNARVWPSPPRLGSIALLYPEGGHIMNTRWQGRAGEGRVVMPRYLNKLPAMRSNIIISSSPGCMCLA